MNAFAVSNLSAGSFSIAFETVAATCGGTVCLSSVSEVASFVRMCTRIDWALGPLCGGCPPIISYSTQPRL